VPTKAGALTCRPRKQASNPGHGPKALLQWIEAPGVSDRCREAAINTFYILTGPESCGKTTLATGLSNALGLPLVNEASRDYLDQKLSADGNFRYDESHLLEIASQQDSTEQLTLACSPDRVICDTDLLVVIVWSEVRFGQCHPWILETFARRIDQRDRHYLLCGCDIPWQPDPLRENADSRPELFELYRQKLDYFELPYTIMRGDESTRLKHALEILDKSRPH